MASVINTNVASLNAQRNLAKTQSGLELALQRLSSGMRINSAKDDAAGLGIATRMTTQINGLNQAARNANDGISLAQTGEGALAEITSNLQRVRELAVQSANSSNSAADRSALDAEVQQRLQEIDRVAQQTAFNGQKILDGTFGSSVFQVGANVGETISVNLTASMRTQSVGAYVNQASTAAQTVTPSAVTDTGGAFLAATGFLSFTGVDNTTALDATNTIKINGTNILPSASYIGASTTQGATSAYAKAAAINASGISGVTATATNTKVMAAAVGGVADTSDFLKVTLSGGTNTVNYSLNVNGTAVLTATGDTSINSAISQINQYQSTTGVYASKTTTGALQLYAADGRDINLSESYTTGVNTTATKTTTVTTVLGAGASTNEAAYTHAATYSYGGQLTLQSSANIALQTVGGGTTTSRIGLTAGTTLLSTAGNLSSLNVTTLSNSNGAILAVDSALNSVTALRGTFGSIQNRFQSAVSTLANVAENLSAARSRIQDADFAAETAALTKQQILQQAGTAMLSQANQLPQSVLSLLK